MMMMNAWQLDAADTTQRDGLRERAQAIEPSETDRKIMRGVSTLDWGRCCLPQTIISPQPLSCSQMLRLCMAPSVDSATEALMHFHEMLRGSK
jgi:hypothetical protein